MGLQARDTNLFDHIVSTDSAIQKGNRMWC